MNITAQDNRKNAKKTILSYVAIFASLSAAVYGAINWSISLFGNSLVYLLLAIVLHPKLRKLPVLISTMVLMLLTVTVLSFTSVLRPASWGVPLADQDLARGSNILPSTDDLIRFVTIDGIQAVRSDGSAAWEWKNRAGSFDTWVQGSYTIVAGDDAYVVIDQKGEARSRPLGERESVVAIGTKVVVIYEYGSGSSGVWTGYSLADGSVVWELKSDETRDSNDYNEPSSIFITRSGHTSTLRSADTGEVIGTGDSVWKSGDYGLIRSGSKGSHCIGASVHNSNVVGTTPMTCDNIIMTEYGSVLIFENRSTYYSFDLKHAEVTTVDCPEMKACFGYDFEVFDDVIVTNSSEGPTVAYDLYTGVELWRRTESGSDIDFAGNAVVVFERANILLGNTPEKLILLDPRTGEPFAVLNYVRFIEVVGGNWLVATPWQSGMQFSPIRLVEISDTN